MRRILTTNLAIIEIALIILVISAAPAAAKTLLQMSTGVRYLLEEPSAYYFGSAEVTFYINQAQNAMMDRLIDEAVLEISNVSTQSVVLNDYANTLPTNCARVTNVFLDGYQCKKKDIRDAWSVMPSNTSGESVSDTNPFYILYGNKIRVFPLQTSAGTLEIHCLKFPTDLSSDSDECDYSDRVEDLVVLQAAVYLLLKDHEGNKAAALEDRLNREIEFLNRQHGMEAKQ